MFFKLTLMGLFMVTAKQLTDRMYEWWNTLFEQRSFTLGPNKPFDISRGRERIITRFGERVQMMGFSPVLDSEVEKYLSKPGERAKRLRGVVPEFAFFAINPGGFPDYLKQSIGQALIPNSSVKTAGGTFTYDVQGADEVRGNFYQLQKEKLRELDRKDRQTCKGTFSDTDLYFGKISYEGAQRLCVLARAPIVRLPEGEGGGLSERLFRYARAYISVPLANTTPE